jgi:drug/metabolite transporter (DMT)-like permease
LLLRGSLEQYHHARHLPVYGSIGIAYLACGLGALPLVRHVGHHRRRGSVPAGALLIGGERTSVLSALEPITGVLIGILGFHESAKPTVLIGSLLVIASSILIAVMDLKKKKSE